MNDKSKEMIAYYNQISQGYDELHSEEQIKKISIMKEYINPAINDKLLDVGCGTGVSTKPWHCTRYGIDPSTKLVEIAIEKRPGYDEFHNSKIEYKVCGAEEIPFDSDEFDFVISATAIQNFSDIKKGINEIYRVLKHSGRIAISTLKRGPKLNLIRDTISEKFTIEKEIEENIDIVFIGTKKN